MPDESRARFQPTGRRPIAGLCAAYSWSCLRSPLHSLPGAFMKSLFSRLGRSCYPLRSTLLAHTLSRVTRIPEALAVALVVLALTGAICAVGWLFGSQLRTQFDLLAVDLPQSLSKLIQDVGSTSWGAWLVEQAKDADLTDATKQIAAHVAALFSSTVRAFAYLAVLLFAAIYLAIQPARYRNGILRLVPPARRDALRRRY